MSQKKLAGIEIGFVTLLTFRKCMQYAWQRLKETARFALFDKLSDYTVQNFVVGETNSDDGDKHIKKEAR